MTGLSRQFADIRAIDPLGRPDILVLIHFEQLHTSWMNDQKNHILPEVLMLRVVNFR